MTTTTPMLKQYHTIKSEHKDAILFFRLGDFYEMFYEDAMVASKTLDLVLTSRGKDASGKIPMCGVPFHAADNYIARLIRAGLKVAICEQTGDPATAQGIVRRDVVRTITSGTYLDEDNDELRYLLCLSPSSDGIGLAFSDASAGTIRTNQYKDEIQIIEVIAKLPVCECIFPETDEKKVKNLFSHPLLRAKNIALSPYADWCFNAQIAKKSLCEHFATHNLSGFGIEEFKSAQSSAGALLEYMRAMNKQPLRHINKITLYSDNAYAYISPAACYGLELETLRKTLDSTCTSLGKRKFNDWLYHPLKNRDAIAHRQEAVSLLSKQINIQEKIKQIFSLVPDVERNLSRLSCGYTAPKDILAIRNTLIRIPEIQSTLSSLTGQNNLFALNDIAGLRQHLKETINPDIPLAHYEGKVIRQGISAELDELKNIQENGRQFLRQLQADEIKRTGINSLKIGFNKVFGYYIEITKANIHLAPDDYIRKQTLVNAERFITPQLKEFEEKILTAQDKIQKVEGEIIQEIQKKILDHSAQLQNFCEQIATIDVLYSLSILANSPGYIAPQITDETCIDVKDGRHPVVEKTSIETFVPNDTLLDCEKNHLLILTGPNMSGKSTYIRQTALLVIMAQLGSFIPAASASIGVVDKIFTRIGAHDDISKGLSTFMVEMTEAAQILNNLSDKSLIILDEIGRGTSTYDGLSLAWALAEHLREKKVRTLFATHFHELTALADEHLYGNPSTSSGLTPSDAHASSGVKNYNVAVKEWKDKIIFMHKIIPGSTDDSYGIYVAKLAGIPKDVILRATQILTQLELQSNLKEKLRGQLSHEDQLTLFSQQEDPVLKEVKAIIEAMDLNSMTPLEALNKLEEIKKLLKCKT